MLMLLCTAWLASAGNDTATGSALITTGNASTQLLVCAPGTDGAQRFYGGTRLSVRSNSSVQVHVTSRANAPVCQSMLDPFSTTTSCNANGALAGNGSSVDRVLAAGWTIRANSSLCLLLGCRVSGAGTLQRCSVNYSITFGLLPPPTPSPTPTPTPSPTPSPTPMPAEGEMELKPGIVAGAALGTIIAAAVLMGLKCKADKVVPVRGGPYVYSAASALPPPAGLPDWLPPPSEPPPPLPESPRARTAGAPTAADDGGAGAFGGGAPRTPPPMKALPVLGAPPAAFKARFEAPAAAAAAGSGTAATSPSRLPPLALPALASAKLPPLASTSPLHKS